MSNTVYTINKGINKAIEFKGLKAQYIWYLGGGLLILLIVFTIMYIIGVHTFICLGITVGLATLLFMNVYRMSHKYGQYGLMKKIARQSLPGSIKTVSRKLFTNLTVSKTK